MKEIAIIFRVECHDNETIFIPVLVVDGKYNVNKEAFATGQYNESAKRFIDEKYYVHMEYAYGDGMYCYGLRLILSEKQYLDTIKQQLFLNVNNYEYYRDNEVDCLLKEDKEGNVTPLSDIDYTTVVTFSNPIRRIKRKTRNDYE